MGYQFPLNFKFKISTIANDFVATDSSGQTIAYVRQKMFKLLEHVDVYADDSRSHLKFTIKANKWLDFSATYTFTDNSGNEAGRVARKGWKSMWKAHYEVFDQNNQPEYTIKEKNPWVKVADSFVSEVPVVNLFSGYLFHPCYIVSDSSGTPLLELKKEGSFFGRRFSVKALGAVPPEDEDRIVLSLMMMILLERRRG